MLRFRLPRLADCSGALGLDPELSHLEGFKGYSTCQCRAGYFPRQPDKSSSLITGCEEEELEEGQCNHDLHCLKQEHMFCSIEEDSEEIINSFSSLINVTITVLPDHHHYICLRCFVTVIINVTFR